jgi:hypothetical protein
MREFLADFQHAVSIWIRLVFKPEVVEDKQERNHRFLAEALELVQSAGCTVEQAHTLVDYVYGRTVGELNDEVGSTMVALAALCNEHGVDMGEAGIAYLEKVGLRLERYSLAQAQDA